MSQLPYSYFDSEKSLHIGTLKPLSFVWVTVNGVHVQMRGMTDNWVATCVRMIWNRYFCQVHDNLEEVTQGRDYNITERDYVYMQTALYVFCCYLSSIDYEGELYTEAMLVKDLAEEHRIIPTEGLVYAVSRALLHSTSTVDAVLTHSFKVIKPQSMHLVPSIEHELNVGVADEQEIAKEFFMSKKIRRVDVRVVYDSGNLQTLIYLTDIQDLEEGDKVVVELRSFYGVGTIAKMDSTRISGVPLKWVVQKIDTASIDKVKADIEEAKKLRAELNEKLEAQRSRLVYETLAKEDPEAAKALERLKELEG